MNEQFNDITIGTRVSPKKTGLPGVGKVVGLITPIVYSNIYKRPLEQMIESYIAWNQHYPYWHQKPIVIVDYDEPRKTMSIEEAAVYDIGPEEIPLSRYIAYCIEDLEVFE